MVDFQVFVEYIVRVKLGSVNQFAKLLVVSISNDPILVSLRILLLSLLSVKIHSFSILFHPAFVQSHRFKGYLGS